MKKEFLEIGKIVSTCGLKGEVRVLPWSDSPDFFMSLSSLYFEEGAQKLTVQKARPQKNVVILKLSGVDTIEAANALRGKVLYMSRADVTLPERTFFVQDLIGLRVIDGDDRAVEYGLLSDVSQTGANDVYHITKNGKTTLIPAIRQVVEETDVEKGIMRIRPMKGLFDDAD